MSTGRGSPVRQPATRCEMRRFIRPKASLEVRLPSLVQSRDPTVALRLREYCNTLVDTYGRRDAQGRADVRPESEVGHHENGGRLSFAPSRDPAAALRRREHV